eukprot:m.10082 g.10082  ORF g.10082 m.10082 type:complete len:62 (+) comp8103_c0_seq1:362-547(+)
MCTCAGVRVHVGTMNVYITSGNVMYARTHACTHLFEICWSCPTNAYHAPEYICLFFRGFLL